MQVAGILGKKEVCLKSDNSPKRLSHDEFDADGGATISALL